MPRQCPPGVICIENITLFVIMILIVIIGFIIYFCKPPQRRHRNMYPVPNVQIPNVQIPNVQIPNVQIPISLEHTDVLLDPYAAPLRDDRYFPKGLPFMRSSNVPINIRTQAPLGLDSEFRQVGILTRKDGGETILPLMGKPLLTNRDKWNFYSMNDKNNMIKVPIKVNGKSASSEYGCDNIYDGDKVFVEGYNQAFKATIYDNQVQRYLPFL
jgi:hypothetical protein